MAIAKCAAIRRDGAKCQGIPVHGSQWCVAHHPAHQEQRREGGRRGGYTAGRGRPKDRLQQVHLTADFLIEQLLKDGIDPKTAAVIVQCGHLKIKAVMADLRVSEQQELQVRMEQLEDQLEAARQREASGW